MVEPTVTTVIPAYRAVHTIGRALDSVLGQSSPPAEVLVIDDGSPDDLSGAVRQYGNRVTLVRKPNGGAASARNLGLDLARGDFVAFVGRTEDGPLVRRAIGAFRAHAHFPSEGSALDARTPGVGWSDHWSFWQVGYPAMMITDTAILRDPSYHGDGDTAEKVDYERFARVVHGIEAVVDDLVSR